MKTKKGICCNVSKIVFYFLSGNFQMSACELSLSERERSEMLILNISDSNFCA